MCGTRQSLTSTTRQDNYSVNGDCISYGGSGAGSISGISGGLDEDILYIINTTANNFTILNQNANSTAANRFVCPGNVDFVIGAYGGVTVRYFSERWWFAGRTN